ncbi:MAG: hypothetical protein KDB62_10510, partial [Solirubrobacterales bacterium]|nr:hypothetical protein [Solirubrobacterales bacterium]
MAEETAEAATEAPTETSTEESGNDFTQEEFNRLLAREKGKLQEKYADYGDLKAAAAKLEEIEQANSSELEKAQKKAAQAEKELAQTRVDLLRSDVMVDKEIPAKLAILLTATDKEGLEAQADLLLENAKPDVPDFDGGVRDTPA